MWRNYFNISSITISRSSYYYSSCYYCFEFKWFRICEVFIWTIFFVLPLAYWCFCIIIAVLYYIIHRPHNIKIICNVYNLLGIIYFVDAVSEWCIQFLNIASLFLAAASAPPPPWSLNKYVRITVITKTWL